MKHILLVRHGESKGNVDINHYKGVADHRIELTDNGKRQAKEAGTFLKEFLSRENGKVRLWHSPYTRARQTANLIFGEIKDLVESRKEHFLLCEQQHGLFDGLTDEERRDRYPAEQAAFEKCVKFEGKFWPRYPLGESPFDVAVRVQQFFGTMYRDLEYNDIDTVVIVSHGVTVRAFTMAYLYKSPEWFDSQRNPKNASIRLIEGKEDKGLIFVPSGVLPQ